MVLTIMHVKSFRLTEAEDTIVSQPSKCLKSTTFREGCFVIRNRMQVPK